MRNKIFSLIALVAIVVGLIATATPAVLAQSGFCNGSEPLIFDHTVLDENTPPCGDGTYVLVAPWADGGPYNPTYKVSGDWATHVRFLKSNGLTNGSFWFQPGVSAPAQPTPAVYPTVIPGAQPTAVANPPSVGQFNCTVGASNLVAGLAVATPPCPPNSVIYALDVENNVTRYTDWTQAENFRAGRVGTYWIEAWPQSEAPTAAPTETPGFNWGNLAYWCLAGLALLTGAILLIAWLIRRRQSAETPAPPARPRTPPAAPTP